MKVFLHSNQSDILFTFHKPATARHNNTSPPITPPIIAPVLFVSVGSVGGIRGLNWIIVVRI